MGPIPLLKIYMEDRDPDLIHGLLAPLSQHPERVSRFCRAHGHDRQTDRPGPRADRLRYPVCGSTRPASL